MKTIRAYWNRWRSDYDFKTESGAALSVLVTIAFALYNGALGLLHRSIWHGSICVYYLLLTAARGAILITERSNHRRDPKEADARRRRTFVATCTVLCLTNLSMVVPVALMVQLKKPIRMGLIPAIAMAAYTTYKVSLASVNLKRKNASANLLVRELRTIGFIDALLSILTLQNTLITVKLEETGDPMLTLSAISGAAILLVVVALTVATFIRGVREAR